MKKQLNHRKEPILQPNKYPFLNPVIITKDQILLDGETRVEVCKSMNVPIQCTVLNFDFKDIESTDALNQFRFIQEKQREKLEKYFLDYKIGYKKQLLLCSSDDRFQKFYDLREKFINKGIYWETLSYHYPLCKNTYRFNKEIKEVFTADVPGKEALMTNEVKGFINNLPETITIYRGMTLEEEECGNYGVSWTLNKKVAEKFAYNYLYNYDTRNKKRIVKEIEINKSNIITYFNDRNEEEIIYIKK